MIRPARGASHQPLMESCRYLQVLDSFTARGRDAPAATTSPPPQCSTATAALEIWQEDPREVPTVFVSGIRCTGLATSQHMQLQTSSGRARRSWNVRVAPAWASGMLAAQQEATRIISSSGGPAGACLPALPLTGDHMTMDDNKFLAAVWHRLGIRAPTDMPSE